MARIERQSAGEGDDFAEGGGEIPGGTAGEIRAAPAIAEKGIPGEEVLIGIG